MAKTIPSKIALLLPSLKFGGAERVALTLARAFKESGAQVDILLMSKEGEFLAEAERHFNVVDLKCSRTYMLPAKLLTYFIGRRPDAMLSSFWKLNLCSCLAKIMYPWVRLLLWEHSPPSQSKNSPTWLYSISASIFYQVANKVVAVSNGVYNDIDQCTLGLRRKLIVIFNPITPPDPALLQRREPLRANKIIWVGRLDEPKNPILLINAFALIADTCDATLAIVGDGQLRTTLEHKCKTLGVTDRVRFFGFYSNPYELISESDLLVLSSDREGFGNVLIEAMFCGLRVVSTDCGQGIHDILLNNYYGSVVPPRNVSALSQAIEHELTSTHAPEEQIRGAQRFLPEVIVKQFISAMQ